MKAADAKRKADAKRAADAKKAAAKKVSVPKKSEVTKADIEKGKKSKVSFNFLLDGWSFREFYRLVEKLDFKLIFMPGRDIYASNFEVTGLDSDGNPVLEKRRWDGNYSPRGYAVENIPNDEETAGWADYDELLREKHSLDSSFQMQLLFPHYIKGSVEDAAKAYNGNSDEVKGKVIFTITKDFDFEVIEIEGG